MLGFILGLIVTILVGYAIVKKQKPQTVLLLGGISLLFFTFALKIGEVVPAEESTGLALFDIFAYLKTTFSDITAGLGLIIMIVGGFAKYMEHIGASNTLVDYAIRPLKNIKRPYLLLCLGYIIGQILNIFIPSASGLGVLLMVTMYPILISLGVSKIAATAMIGTSACLDLGPASGNANLAATTSGIEVSEYFLQYQLPVAVVTIITIAVLHYIVQLTMDKKEGLHLKTKGESVDKKEEIAKAPGVYALLPLLPLVLILVFSPFVIDSIKMHVITAMLISLFISMVFEVIRYKDVKTVFESIQIFFNGMGSQFAKVVTLVIAGKTFAYGLTQIGFIDFIIDGAQSANLGVIPMTLVMIIVIALSSVIMGSGNAPFFAFASLAPEVAEPLGVATVLMALPMQLTAGIARSVSPITAVIIAVAGISGVDTVQLVKRTAIPMIGGLIVMTITSFVLF